MRLVEYPSPNHAARQPGARIAQLVLHYTELDLAGSLATLTDSDRPHRVSSHYVLAEDGTAYRLVPEDRLAWHAGRSHWRGQDGLNATSIGIEIVNLHGDRHDYPQRQIEALCALCHDILARHPGIVARNVVGHSDVAPHRKIDPGLRFPWQHLAGVHIGLWPRSRRSTALPESSVVERLVRFGYPPPHSYVDGEGKSVAVGPRELIAAFQRRYRPGKADGGADDETQSRLDDLLDQVGNVP